MIKAILQVIGILLLEFAVYYIGLLFIAVIIFSGGHIPL